MAEPLERELAARVVALDIMVEHLFTMILTGAQMTPRDVERARESLIGQARTTELEDADGDPVEDLSALTMGAMNEMLDRVSLRLGLLAMDRQREREAAENAEAIATFKAEPDAPDYQPPADYDPNAQEDITGPNTKPAPPSEEELAIERDLAILGAIVPYQFATDEEEGGGEATTASPAAAPPPTGGGGGGGAPAPAASSHTDAKPKKPAAGRAPRKNLKRPPKLGKR